MLFAGKGFKMKVLKSPLPKGGFKVTIPRLNLLAAEKRRQM
jgi:hypothetical protein